MIERFEGEYRFLSNFYDYTICVKGRLFASSEHAYQAAKTFDPWEQKRVQQARSPFAAKREGRKATLRPDWDNVKIEVMRIVLSCKFPEGGALVPKLLATAEEELVEGNDHGDDYWGMVWDGAKWVGENQLGRLLMERRWQLRGH